MSEGTTSSFEPVPSNSPQQIERPNPRRVFSTVFGVTDQSPFSDYPQNSFSSNSTFSQGVPYGGFGSSSKNIYLTTMKIASGLSNTIANYYRVVDMRIKTNNASEVVQFTEGFLQEEESYKKMLNYNEAFPLLERYMAWLNYELKKAEKMSLII